MQKNRVNDYVRKIFQKEFCEYHVIYNMQIKNGKEIISRINDLVDNLGYSEEDILSHKADYRIRFIISDVLKKYPDENVRKELRTFRTMNEYIKDKLNDNGLLVGANDSTLSGIISVVAKNLSVFYSSKDFDNPKFDKVIIDEFNSVFLECKKDIARRVNNILDDRMDVLTASTNIDYKNVIRYVASCILNDKDDKYNYFISKRDGSLNKYINELINSYLSSNKKKDTSNIEDSSEYLKRVSKNMRDSSISYDDKKSRDINVGRDEGLKYNPRRKQIPKSIFVLLLTGSLVASSYFISKDIHNKMDDRCIQTVAEYSEHDIVGLYDKLSFLGDENVRMLGFYLEYNDLDNMDTLDRLQKMETKFMECKSKLTKNGNDSNLSKAVRRQNTSPNGADLYGFLDFVYGVLKEQGVDIVNNSNYREALSSYKLSTFATEYGTTVRKSGVSPYHKKLIQNVMDKYCEINRENAIKVGKIIENDSRFSDYRDGLKGVSK